MLASGAHGTATPPRAWMRPRPDRPRRIDRYIDYFGLRPPGALARADRDGGVESTATLPGRRASRSRRARPRRGWRALDPIARLTVLVALLGAAASAGGCGVATAPSPGPRTGEVSRPAPSGRPVDPAVAQRLQRTMVPLLQHMDRPLPVNEVRVGILDTPQINAANAGSGEFYVTRGLLERANDEQLRGVLAHEIAHADLNHVAKTQTLGTGLNIGMVLLEQIFPGSGAITPIAGELILRGYTRREEYAADAHGAEILSRAGFNGREMMVNTLRWLEATAGPGQGGFFSTHPGTGDRIQALARAR
jgi:Zn-dependent protease with chaperone function